MTPPCATASLACARTRVGSCLFCVMCNVSRRRTPEMVLGTLCVRLHIFLRSKAHTALPLSMFFIRTELVSSVDKQEYEYQPQSKAEESFSQHACCSTA